MKTSCLLCVCFAVGALVAAEVAAPAPVADVAKIAPPPPDEITCKDNNVVKAYIGSMSDGELVAAAEPNGVAPMTIE